MKKLLFINFILATISLSSYGQTWLWGKQGSGATKDNDFGAPVATDMVGNAYISKQFIGGQITFEPDTLFAHASENMYIVKYNSAGIVKWAKIPYQESGGDCIITGIATDRACHVFVTGYFDDTVKFGSDILYSAGLSMFLVKYDSNGTALWAQQTGPNVFPQAVTTDEKGNSYVTGYFINNTTIGAYLLSNPHVTLFAGLTFIVKYDANGSIRWVKQSTNNSRYGYGEATAISADQYNNTYITGFFTDTLNFGAQSLTCSSAQKDYGDVYIVKYDSSGNMKWAKQATIASQKTYGIGYGIIADKSGGIYLTGYFTDTMSFGSHKIISNGDSNLFVAKYDTTGNPLWAEQSSEGPWLGYGLSADQNDNMYLTGVGRADTLKFSTLTLNNGINKNSSFIIEITTAGAPLCGSMLLNGGGTGRNYECVASDSTGKYIYITGSLLNDTIFCASDTLISDFGGAAPYIARWKSCTGGEAGINTLSSASLSVLLFPNPNDGVFTVKSSVVNSRLSAEVYNILGERVYSQFNILNSTFNIDLSSQPSGVYLYRVLNIDGSLCGEGKLIIQK